MLMIILLAGLLFLFFSYLQINDPDSSLWIIAYLIPSILSFSSILNCRNRYSYYLSPAYFIIAIYLHFNNSETKVMHIFNEITNESLGLILCSIWILILPLLSNQFKKN